MVPFMVLLVSLLVLRGLGALGIGAFAVWQNDACYALALMFLLTATVHFTKTKDDLIRMVPRVFPMRQEIVAITGVLEIAGAVGLVIPATRPFAAIALVVLLIAMFPANINAALRKIPFRGGPALPLWQRIPMQLVFIGVTWWASRG